MVRETYYTALFNLLMTLSGTQFKTVSRKLRLPANMNPADYDALFMTVDKQPIKQQLGLPAVHTLGAQLTIYVSNTDDKVSADPKLNAAIDAVEKVLKPCGLPTQTLGGLVQNCWIEGTIEVFSGSNSQFAAAVIPVKILVP